MDACPEECPSNASSIGNARSVTETVCRRYQGKRFVRILTKLTHLAEMPESALAHCSPFAVCEQCAAALAASGWAQGREAVLMAPIAKGLPK